MKTKTLIALLSDQSVHSGAFLAAELGVSRTTVWKQVGYAIQKGYSIETVRGRGYRLTRSVDLLDAEEIAALLPEERQAQISIKVMDTVDSTNAELIRGKDWHFGGVKVCLADTQTAGRGRRGRSWQSPAGENLYLSLGLNLEGGFGAIEGLSLVIGVAIVETLESMGIRGLGLKWPNDVMHKGRKLAGILIELHGELDGAARVVAGIGVNVHMQQAPEVDQAWASLALIDPSRGWKRNQLAAALVASVLNAVDQFSEAGFGAFCARWQQRDIFMGQSLTRSPGDTRGIGQGIDESGHYRIRTEAGTEVVGAGEISLRADT